MKVILVQTYTYKNIILANLKLFFVLKNSSMESKYQTCKSNWVSLYNFLVYSAKGRSNSRSDLKAMNNVGWQPYGL